VVYRCATCIATLWGSSEIFQRIWHLTGFDQITNATLVS